MQIKFLQTLLLTSALAAASGAHAQVAPWGHGESTASQFSGWGAKLGALSGVADAGGGINTIKEASEEGHRGGEIRRGGK